MSILEDTDAILRATGDVLLQLGADTPRRVPNSPVNSVNLNAAIDRYQKHLDALELEVVRALGEARRRTARPAAAPELEDSSAVPQQPLLPDEQAPAAPDAQPPADPDEAARGLDLDFDQNGLGQGLDASDLFGMDDNGLGMFGETSPRQDYSLDDGFF